MHARVTRVENTPDKIEAVVTHLKEQIIPAAKKMAGFKGGYWLIERSTGRGLAVTLFESEAALKASEDAASQTRSGASQATGMKVTGVERYEVVAQA